MNDHATWQFRLSDLFALMTLSAVAAAVAAAWGPGTLLLTIGVTLAFANWRGALAPLQHGRRQTWLLGLAWGVFLISLALPSIQVFGSVPGWGAAWLAIAMPLEAIWSDTVKVDKPTMLLWHAGINLANGLLLLLPLLIWRLRAGHGQWLSIGLSLAMVFPWSAGWGTSMLVGYYVWCGAFYLALCALPLRWQTLAAMVVLACVLGLAAAKQLL